TVLFSIFRSANQDFRWTALMFSQPFVIHPEREIIVCAGLIHRALGMRLALVNVFFRHRAQRKWQLEIVLNSTLNFRRNQRPSCAVRFYKVILTRGPADASRSQWPFLFRIPHASAHPFRETAIFPVS